MKVVLLAGGFGTRLSEETESIPKPMVEIGAKPILVHIMDYYSAYGFNEFIICLGYKGYCIKDYFANYFLHQSDVTFDFSSANNMQIHSHKAKPWKVTLVDTGLNSMTGGRIKRIQRYVGNEPFMLTYGDGLSDVDLHKLTAFHQANKKMITVTAIQPEGRFGALDINSEMTVEAMIEKPKGDNAWINGGFFVCQPQIFEQIKGGDQTIFESQVLNKIAEQSELAAYKHSGFWKPMDTLRDKIELEKMYHSGNAPWIK